MSHRGLDKLQFTNNSITNIYLWILRFFFFKNIFEQPLLHDDTQATKWYIRRVWGEKEIIKI